MQCFVVAPDHSVAKVAMLERHARQLGLSVETATGLDALLSQRNFIEDNRPIVLVADLSSSRKHADNALGFAVSQAGRAYVVYVSDTIEPDIYKQLLKTRTADWSKWELAMSELSDLVKQLNESETADDSNAQIVCFFPSKGGVGNSTLASEVAVSLATTRSRGDARIALLDLNLDGGTLADTLALEARFDILEVTGHPERLDSQMIDVFASRHSERLDVFAPLPRWVSLSEIAPETIFAILDLLAGRYDMILIDMPKQKLPWTDNLLRGSDLVVVSGHSTVPALKQLRAKLAQLRDLTIADTKIAVLVNQCEKSILGQVARRKDIQRALPSRNVFFVREDAANVRAAANAGLSVIESSPGSQISSDIGSIVRWVAPAVALSPVAATGKSR